MTSKTTERNARPEAEPQAEPPDFKWAVEWLVQQQGQRRAAEILGVNRKTVALALRRERLTGRMNHAVQTLLARLDDPVAQEVMPLERMESQIRFLLKSMDELDRLVESLDLRVQAFEEAQVQTQGDTGDDGEGVAHEDKDAESEGQHDERAEEQEPERGQDGRRFGGWRRRVP